MIQYADIKVDKKLKFHILGIPNTATNRKFAGSAYTQNVYMMCEILTKLGHEVIHYGNHGSNPICTENVEILNKSEFDSIYNGIDLEKVQFDSVHNPHINTFISRCITNISSRITGPKEFILGFWGIEHQNIAQMINSDIIYVEPCVGSYYYTGGNAVFPSYSNMHIAKALKSNTSGSWYDSVIPHGVDHTLYTFNESGSYFLFMGRLNEDKGLQLAINLSNEMGFLLKIAGQGDISKYKLSSNQQYVGYVTDQEEKSKLISGATAMLCPSQYFEPFGLAVVEAGVSGVPSITTDWGAYPENVVHGETGYRCRTHKDFINAITNIHKLDRHRIQYHFINTYSYQSIAAQYQDYFSNLFLCHINNKWQCDSSDNTDLYKSKNISVIHKKELVIYNSFASGFGDMLLYTHIPRLAKESGMYDKVYISSHQTYRYSDHKEILWDINPWVDGFISKRASHPETVAFPWEKLNDSETICDRIAVRFGIPIKAYGNSPEIYYRPEIKTGIDKSMSIYDPNSWTYGIDKSLLLEWITRNNIKLDAQIALNPAFKNGVSISDDISILDINISNTYDYIDTIFSAGKLYSRLTASTIIAGMYKIPFTAFYSTPDEFSLDVYSIWKKSPNVEYIKL